jgi:hypothetical protein
METHRNFKLHKKSKFLIFIQEIKFEKFLTRNRYIFNVSRTSPLDAVFWQGMVEQGEIRCRGCDEFVDLDNADDINEAIEIWNNHVKSEHK